MNDLRYAVRVLLKSPGFTIVAAAMLALGIGANTAMYSVVHSVLLRRLPYKDPDRLLVVWDNARALGRPRNLVAPANFLDWMARNRVFDDMAVFVEVRYALTGAGEPEDLQAQRVSASFFSVLGVQPALGRNFVPEEDRPGWPRTAILSHRLWQRRFASDPGVLGRSLSLSGIAMTVIGVLPADCQLPVGGQLPEVWTTLQLDPAQDYRATAGHYLRAVGRLRPGVSISQAQAEMDAIARSLEQEHRRFNAGWGVTLVPVREQLLGEVRPALLVLLGAVGVVLLIACANVANLLLARASVRKTEMAVRASLGASQGRLIRQLLTESLVLSTISGLLGLLLAWWGTRLLVAIAPKTIPRLDEIGVQAPMLAATLAISALTGIIFGLAPALSAARTNLQGALKESGARTGGGAASQNLRRALVAAQLALSLVLLIAAGLLIRSFAQLRKVDPGFQPHNLLTVRVTLPLRVYTKPQQWGSFFQRAVDHIGALPGVQAAGATGFLPFSGLVAGAYFQIEGRPVPPEETPVGDFTMVTPSYFRAMGIPLRKGRLFSERDTAEAPKVFVINDTMARRHFPNEDPIGRRLTPRLGDGQPGEIVGIVGDVSSRGFDGEMLPMIFYPISHFPNSYMTFVVRTASDPHNTVSAVVGVIRSMDPNLPAAEVRTMEEVLSDSLSRHRFNTLLLGIFAAAALALAVVGIYGVMSYMVTQRGREIVIRMALGATQMDVLRMVVGQAALLAIVGIGAGLAGALALTRLMAGLLVGVSATDAAVFGGVSTALMAVALLAAWIPARRAARVNPATMLRHE